MRTLRILLVANALPPHDLSGAGEQVVQLGRALAARGHRVEILGRGAWGRGAWGPKVLFPGTVIWPAVRWIRRFRPDVVQVHESDGGLLVLALRLLRRWLPAFVLCALQQVSYREERRAVRSLRDVGTGAILARPNLAELTFRWFRTPIQIALGIATARWADVVLAPSKKTAAELRRDYGARQVAVVPNTTTPLANSPSGAGEHFLYVGRFRIRKGIEVLLAAVRQALAEAPDLRLRLAGGGEREAVIARRIRDLGVTEAVEIVGRVRPEQARELLVSARALVVPSTYEGMPLVVLEAMARSRAVIASAVSGIPEVVIDPETGWLVASEDVAALGSALVEAWRNPADCMRRGEMGRQRLEQTFLPAHAATAWEQALAAVLDEVPEGTRR